MVKRYGARVPLADGQISLSHLAAGCWRLLEQSGGKLAVVNDFIDTALAHQITSFDHADIYGDYQVENLFGQALAQRPQLREGIEIITKCGIAPASPHRPDRRVTHIDLSASHIIASVERSLMALRTDWIDVLLLHRPDPLADVDEISDALVALRESGKVRAFGVSNFSVGKFDLLQSRLPFPLVTNQVEISLLHTQSLQDGTLDQLQQKRLPAMAWSPLAGGRLFTSEGKQAASLRLVLSRLADQYGVDPAAIAIAWVLSLPEATIPIIGSAEPAKFKRLATGVTLDRQDWFELLTCTGYTVA